MRLRLRERGVRLTVERTGLVAVRAIRAEAQGICSRSPVVERRWVAYGKSNFASMCFGDFCGSFLPERIFKIAARRTISGSSQGETTSGAVISGDMLWRRNVFGRRSQRGCEVLSGRKDLLQRGLSAGPDRMTRHHCQTDAKTAHYNTVTSTTAATAAYLNTQHGT